MNPVKTYLLAGLRAIANIPPNRIAVYAASVVSLAGALVPVTANLDLTSTAGVVAGVFAFVTVVRKWLDGWQIFEHTMIQQGIQQATLASQQRNAPPPGSKYSPKR